MTQHSDYSLHEELKIYYANLVCSALGIIGCGFIILLYCCNPRLRKGPFRLIFYLTIADLGTSIGYIIPFMESEVICNIQGYFLSYFSLSSVLWCGCLAHAISTVILKGSKISQYELKYLALGFLLPLLTFLVIIDIKTYKVALGWCWIQQRNRINNDYYRAIAYRMLTYYIPLAIVLIYISVSYIKVISFIRQSELFSSSNKSIQKSAVMKLKIYPLILIVSLLPGLILRIVSFNKTPPWWMTLIAGTACSLNGLFNSIAYGLTQEVKKELKRILCIQKQEEIQILASKSNI